jgi:hypothetical protein
MKNSSAAFLSTHLQNLLQDFINIVLETFALSYTTFYQNIRSDDLCFSPSHLLSSFKFDFKPILSDGIKTSENAIALSEKVTAYVETAQHDLA